MKSVTVKEIEDIEIKKNIAGKILRDLPEWFGIEEATENYIKESGDYPFVALYEDKEAIGFASLKETGEKTAEIFVMGIMKKFHGRGYGRILYEAFENLALNSGYEFLQVKTVRMGHYKEYDDTNQYYRRMGFTEFECIPDLWDECNPCQIYVKYIKNRD